MSECFQSEMEALDKSVNGYIDNLLAPKDPMYMQNRQPVSFRGILVVYNFFSNTAVVVHVLRACYNPCPVVYYFSKLIEFMDTFLFILRKNNHQITVLHVYHHASMLNIWWFFMNWVPCGHSYFALYTLCDLHLHFVLYTVICMVHTTIPAMCPYLWWKKYITQCQLTKFVLTMTQNTCAMNCYMVSLNIMFSNFYIQTFNEKARSKRKDYQNRSVSAVNGHTNSFSSLENNVKQRKQRKD
uniref:Elongation of very long chain fatty acids protein n=1 Tax=Leptobrachium leishanense TaxID=445787 RepID=A0A8C5PWE6_9ANUR